MTEDSRLFDRLCGHGDIREIANITGFNVSYVRKVLDHQRTNNMIYDIANDLITMRDRIRRKYKVLINESGKEKSFSKVRDVENLLIDLQFRPTRSLAEDALRLLHIEQKQPSREIMVKAREKLSLYDRHILESLDWLSTQRLQVEPAMEILGLWPMVKYASSFLTDSYPDMNVTIAEGDKGLSVWADRHLAGSLIRALVYHMHRITAPDGVVHLEAQEQHDEVRLQLKSKPCLLNKHTFEMLENNHNLKITRPQADNLEAVAVAGTFVMELHNGSLVWQRLPDREGTVTLVFPKNRGFPEE
ncbi:hypothetical protein AB9P05_14335 [Roseivirga sp. BDSF3-8]|uniref:hypothetical protein n=1 Tax=Roseivirga sp. BDSF3-8 TaxID=3241598 RepID=UPI003531B885